MKLTLPFLLASTLYFTAEAQTGATIQESHCKGKSAVDSSFIKLITGINQLLRERVGRDFPKFSAVNYSNYVMIDQNEKVSIDSLSKYKLKDFKSITISFDESHALYGGKAEQGVIMLKRRKSN